MKTIQQLYNEVMANEDLKARFIEAARDGKAEAFLKEQGCEATMEEVSAFLKEKSQEDAPLSLDELENAAGGKCNQETAREAALSVFGIAGLACVAMAVGSAAIEGGHVGQKNEDDGRLCSAD